VTTILKKAMPFSAIGWASRVTAEFAADQIDLLPNLKRDEIIDLLKGAPFRDRDRAANRGTEVHNIAKKMQTGAKVEVDDAILGHVDAYLKFLREWQPTEEHVERPVFNRKWRYAGTLDNLCHIKQITKGWCLLDYKTNRSGPFGETGLQLVAYGGGKHFTGDAGDATFFAGVRGGDFTMPAIDFYGVVWLRPDGEYSLFPYQLTDKDWRTFLYCRHLAWWIDNRQKIVKGDEIWIPAPQLESQAPPSDSQ
jgi:hypothetical protein